MSTTTSNSAAAWTSGFSPTGDGRAQRGRPDWTDIAFFLLLAAGAGFALTRFSGAMEKSSVAPCRRWPGWGGCGGRCAT